MAHIVKEKVSKPVMDVETEFGVIKALIYRVVKYKEGLKKCGAKDGMPTC